MTLYAVFSDIHANFTALCAAADDARKAAKSLNDELFFLCLGDVVDYGPQPNECMQWIREQKDRVLAVVQGNFPGGIFILFLEYLHALVLD